MGTNNCESENVTCEDIKTELEMERHQTEEAIEKTGVRLKKVEIESKQKLEQLQDLKSKVNNLSYVLSMWILYCCVIFIVILAIIVSPSHHRAAANTLSRSLVFNQGTDKSIGTEFFCNFPLRRISSPLFILSVQSMNTSIMGYTKWLLYILIQTNSCIRCKKNADIS